MIGLIIAVNMLQYVLFSHKISICIIKNIIELLLIYFSLTNKIAFKKIIE